MAGIDPIGGADSKALEGDRVGPALSAGDQEVGGRAPTADGRAAPSKAADSKTAGSKQGRSLVRELPILIIVALVIAIVIKSFVVQAFVIPTGSMQNTLSIRDKILVNKLVYDFRPIRAGDIVVFDGAGSWNAPATASSGGSNPLARAYDDTLRKMFDAIGGLFGTPIGQTDYVKRVIGVPGDHVVCCNANGLITVNGVPLHEQSYLYPGNQPSSSPAGIPGHFNVTVPAGYLWVLGDHRSISDDSRGHEADPGNGMIPEDEVIGRAFLIAWPPSHWRILSIPATFEQPGITKVAASAGTGAATATPADFSAVVRPAAPYVPTAAGFTATFPVWWAFRRFRTRRGRARGRGHR